MIQKYNIKILFILFLSGAFAALALAPLFYIFMIYIAFVILLYLLFKYPLSAQKCSSYQFGLYIFIFMLGWFITALYWIGYSLIPFDYDYIIFAPIMPLALSLLFASYYGILGIIIAKIIIRWQLSQFHTILLLIVMFALGDYIRSFLLTGFNWAKFISIFGGDVYFWQLSYWIGEDAVNILIITSLCFFAFAVIHHHKRILIIALCIPLFLWVFGAWRLDNYDYISNSITETIRIIQPNITLQDKWSLNKRLPNTQKMADLASENRSKNIDIILFPEAAIASIDRDELILWHTIAQATPINGYSVIGTPMRHQTIQDGYSNSMVVIDNNADIKYRYDKHHLVPFGEYVPFLEWWDMAHIFANKGSYFAGTYPKTWHINNRYQFLPLICYEIIFDFNTVLQKEAHHANAILNITNDTWFGNTTGPYQHLQMAQLRAVTSGLPVYRSANTGISAAIDSFGRIQKKIALNMQGYIDVPLFPKAPEDLDFIYRHMISFVILILLVISPIIVNQVVVNRGHQA